MRRMVAMLSACVVLGLTSAALAEQMDNPEYTQWSKYKPGTYVTLQQSTSLGGAAPAGMPAGMDISAVLPKTSTTTKLTEVKADALTLEVTTETTQMGQTRSNKSTRTVSAKIEKPAATATATSPAATQGQMKDLKEGKETLEVAGKKLETNTMEYTGANAPDVPGMARGGRSGEALPSEAHVKIWNSPEVPGGMVKMEMTAKQQEMEIKSSSMVTDYKVVK